MLRGQAREPETAWRPPHGITRTLVSTICGAARDPVRSQCYPAGVGRMFEHKRAIAVAGAALIAIVAAPFPWAANAPASRPTETAASAPPPASSAPAQAAPPPAAPRGGLTIVKPRALEIVSGKVTIEVGVPEALGAPAVEVLVDGAVVGRLTAPPYQLSYDFGDTLRPRKIGARIAEGPGSGMRAEITTRGFDARKIDQIARVDLVSLYVSVRDGSGRYITDLPSQRFRVLDSGRPQQITHFGLEQRPLAAAIVIDCSFSMKGEMMQAARDAATRFVKSLRPDDRAMVVTFSDAPTLASDLTVDRESAVAAIGSAEAKGGTALYDAIYMTADRLSREDGRKVIVLLSDGRDEAQNGIEPGSLHTFDEALEKSLRSEAILFTIGFGKKLATERDF